MQALLMETDTRGICRLTLNRSQSANALDEQLISDLIDALEHLATLRDCRVLLLQGAGKHFSAGADLGWMQRQAQMDYDANVEDAARLAKLMQVLDEFPKPTIALVQGAAYGGALGLICCCDIVLAAESARFCLSEVKLGLIPAVISPYVNRSIGMRQLRRYALSAEVIDAFTALQLGLVHQLASELDHSAAKLIDAILQGSPEAQRQCKSLLAKVNDKSFDDSLRILTARAIADARSSSEAHEGMSAFFEKRAASWQVSANTHAPLSGGKHD
ncbi:enoyl-CoA hydratase/isomerase family protein [Shewanella avicenniae]|uniref:Enoyl-CoA hydratase/isomerase family protein n=1 Tax=Shewanella avicenniae TaxID=2814294 RepID=A0ABX7QMT5_9GAMM|nr:enoyl-CoA hydratase-related protein [Shewanella avicenniae]QSX32762.1 enoyl-CoA hydratase/isomerase family protein [Shewanella avicenniae]